MPDRTVYLLETGLSSELPGLAPRAVGASFPFWGTHALLDFAFTALRPAGGDPPWLVCDSRDRQPVQQAGARWGRAAFRQRDAEDAFTELKRLAASERASTVVVSTLSYAAFLEPGVVDAAADIGTGRRLRVDGTELPVYVLPRESFLKAVDDAARQPAEAGGSLRGFAAAFLPERFREHLEARGRVFFTDSLMQLWDAHHFLRESSGGNKTTRYVEPLEAAAQPQGEAHIAATGDVRDSLIAAGAHVDGTVVDSFLFPGVIVRRGAEVRQCVLMSGTRVGADAKVSNTLALPAAQELGGETESVGAGAEVGDTRNVMNTRNDDYPKQIARGITVLGMNVAVPAGMEVGSACYLGPGSSSILKNMKKLARGASIR
jgi:hypothetical protein